MKKPMVVNAVVTLIRRVRPINPCHMVPVQTTIRK